VKIDVLMPDKSSYQALHYFTKKVYEALVSLGHQCRLLEGDDRYKATLKEPPELMVGFNGALEGMPGFFWCDLLEVPFLSLLVDPPFFLPKSLR